MPKSRTLKQQRLNGELGLIIDEMGRAMWNADRHFITDEAQHCFHYYSPHFTPNMEKAWAKYVDFCRRNPV